MRHKLCFEVSVLKFRILVQVFLLRQEVQTLPRRANGHVSDSGQINFKPLRDSFTLEFSNNTFLLCKSAKMPCQHKVHFIVKYVS